MNLVTLYECDICKQRFETAEGAIACESTGTDRTPCQVGDIVLRGGFGWYDGDERWIAFRAKDTYRGIKGLYLLTFYYVVTAIDLDNHRTRIHVVTKAMKSGYTEGYTYVSGHVPVEPIKGGVPQFVLDDSKDLIGRKARYLL